MYQDLLIISPTLVLVFGAFLILLGDVFSKSRKFPSGYIAIFIFLLALFFLQKSMPIMQPGLTIFHGLVFADFFSAFFTALILGTGTLTILLGLDALPSEGIDSKGEYYSLMLFATVGAIVFISSAELITLFVGLEIMSLALYALCGSSLGGSKQARTKSTEAALKYFLLGSFSSAFLLYGISLVYGLTGTTFLLEIAPRLSQADANLLYLALGFILVGLFFKISLVPFHFWAPDVYEGAPTPVTAYMSSVVKIAAVGAAIRVLFQGFAIKLEILVPAIWIMTVSTMVVGNLLALRQRNLKRMLAYSSIAHAGYIGIGFLAYTLGSYSVASILYYLVAYSLLSIGTLAVLQAILISQTETSADLSSLNGLSSRQPFLAFSMSIFMLGLAGLPIGMSGLLGKFYLFNAAIRTNNLGLAIIGMVCSAVSCYYYLRVIVSMYFVPTAQTATGTIKISTTSPALIGVVFVCALGAVVLGIFPSIIFEPALHAIR